MIEEQSSPVAIKELQIRTLSTIFQTNIDEGISKIIHDVYEKADTSFNEGKVKDNLIKTDRTGWLIHEDYPDDMHPVLDVICKALHDSFLQRNFGQQEFDLNINLVDSWIARSKEGAVVDPHHHGLLPTSWSFCYYAEIPSGKSSITFMDNSLGFKVVVNVDEGDLIWFPSHLTHYTVDTEEGRMIYSGNAFIGIINGQPQPKEDD